MLNLEYNSIFGEEKEEDIEDIEKEDPPVDISYFKIGGCG